MHAPASSAFGTAAFVQFSPVKPASVDFKKFFKDRTNWIGPRPLTGSKQLQPPGSHERAHAASRPVSVSLLVSGERWNHLGQIGPRNMHRLRGRQRNFLVAWQQLRWTTLPLLEPRLRDQRSDSVLFQRGRVPLLLMTHLYS